MLVIAILAGLSAFFLFRQISEHGIGGLSLSAPSFIKSLVNTESESSNASPSNLSENTDSNLPLAITNMTPWDGASQVTILILGLDARDWEAGEKYSRSDTMIMLTLDPVAKTAGMLSIPRDMWVAIPGFKHGKINTAYFLGEAYKLPGGGPGLAINTVEQFLGVPINYYAQIDFGAFVRFIDEIGGVKIDIPEKITVDLIGGGASTKKTLKPGVQVLPGEWALAYARNRSTEGGDFDRAQRQQQVILAIRDRILSLQMLSTLITKAPTLYKELASGLNTNLNVDEAIKLALLAQEVGEENIERGVISEEHTIFGRSPDNLSILIPIPDKIHLLRDQIFASSNALSPKTPGDELERVQSEAARLNIINTSNSPTLASSTAEFLGAHGVNVVQTIEGGDFSYSTKIIDHTGNPFLLNYLVDLMGISPQNILMQFEPNNAADVEIYLGDDWANSNPIP